MFRVYTTQEFDQNFYNWKITDITFTSNLPKLSPEEQRFGVYDTEEYFIVFYPDSLEKVIDSMVEILAKKISPDRNIDSLRAHIKNLLSGFKRVLMALFSKVDFPLIIVYFHYKYMGGPLISISNVNAHVYVIGSKNNQPSMIMIPKALYIPNISVLSNLNEEQLSTIGIPKDLYTSDIFILNSEVKAQISTKGYNIKPHFYLFILNLREDSDLYRFISIHPVFKVYSKHKILTTLKIDQQTLERSLADEYAGYYELVSIIYKQFIDQIMAKGDYRRLVKNIIDVSFTADNIYDTLVREGALFYLNDIVEYCIDAVIENVLTDMISNIMNQNPEINTYEEIIDHISFEELENRVKESCLEYIRNTLVIDPSFVYTYLFEFLVEYYYQDDTDIEFIESILSYAFDRNKIEIIKRLLYSIKMAAYQTANMEEYHEFIENLKEEVINKYLEESFKALYTQQPDLFIGELRELMTEAFPELFPEVWERYAERRLPNIISNIIAG